MRQPVGRALWRVSCPYRGPFRFGLRAGPMGLWWLDGQEFSKLFEMEEIVDAGGFRPTQIPARPAAAALEQRSRFVQHYFVVLRDGEKVYGSVVAQVHRIHAQQEVALGRGAVEIVD